LLINENNNNNKKKIKNKTAKLNMKLEGCSMLTVEVEGAFQVK